MQNRSTTLAKLMFVRESMRSSPSSLPPPSFYVRHPVQPGVQMMLGVQQGETRLRLVDSVTLLPQIVPFPRHVITRDPVLVAAYDIVEQAYRDEVVAPDAELRHLPFPRNVLDPTYHSEDEKQFVEGMEDWLRTCAYRWGEPMVQDKLFDRYLRRFYWTPFILQQGHVTLSPKWRMKWRILSLWNKWEVGKLSWKQRLNEFRSTSGIRNPGSFAKNVNTFTQYCLRLLQQPS